MNTSVIVENRNETSILAKLWSENQVLMHIVSDPIFHERIMYIEIDYHFMRENSIKVDFYKICEDWISFSQKP